MNTFTGFLLAAVLSLSSIFVQVPVALNAGNEQAVNEVDSGSNAERKADFHIKSIEMVDSEAREGIIKKKSPVFPALSEQVEVYRKIKKDTAVSVLFSVKVTYELEKANGKTKTSEADWSWIVTADGKICGFVRSSRISGIEEYVELAEVETIDSTEDSSYREVTTEAESETVPETTAPPETEAQPETTAPAPQGTNYVVNTNTGKFHYSYCNSVNQMKAQNRWDICTTRDYLIGLGYVPCKNCNP